MTLRLANVTKQLGAVASISAPQQPLAAIELTQINPRDIEQLPNQPTWSA